MTSTGPRDLPNAAARVRILLVYLLTIASAVVVFLGAPGLFPLFHTAYIEELLKLPFTTSWEAYELEPWLVVVGHAFIGLILLGCALYGVQGTRAFLHAWAGRQDVDLYARSSGKILLTFWVLAILACFFACALSFGILGGVSHGLD